MRYAIFGVVAALVGTGTLHAQSSAGYAARNAPTPDTVVAPDSELPRFQVTPYIGWVFYGNYFKRSNDVTFSHENRPVYGASANVNLSRNIALVGNFAYSKTRWTFKNYFGPGQDLNLSDVGIWLYDGAIQLRLPSANPSGSSFTPFLQAGAGAIRYTANATNFSGGNTNFAFNVGLGADVQMNRNVGVRLMGKDYITQLDWSDASHVNITGNKANSIAVSLGLNLGF